MVTIKSYTDILQSIKLAKILPLESADLWYSYYGNSKYNPTFAYEGEQWFLSKDMNGIRDIPCWSLAALLNILYDYTLQTNSNGDVFVVCNKNKPVISDVYDSPINACYETIIKLKELNLI